MASSFTAGQIVDMARARHPKFAEMSAPDGALVLALDARQRTLLLQYAGAVEGLYNTTAQLAAVVSGILVGVSASGTPQYTTTFQDGWVLHVSAGGTPYIDPTEAPVAGDPFGQNGGVPGFPLPTDFLKLINATVVYADGHIGPVDVVPETARTMRLRSHMPTVFVSGNRLIPVRPLATGNANDVWASGITAVQLSYVGFPQVTSLASQILVPAALMDALITGLAESLATMVPGVTPADSARLAAATLKAESALETFSVDMVGAVSPQRVAYRG